MSRLYTRNSRGRQPLLSGPKVTRSKEYADDTYHEPSSRRHRATRKYATTVQQAKRKRVASTASDSSGGSLDDEDASDEDSQSDDDEEPAVLAPSRPTLVGGAGRKTRRRIFDAASLAGSVDSMFGDYHEYYGQNEDPELSPDENLKRFEDRVFTNSDDDDDDVYRGVDEISDSDDDDVDQYEEQQLLAALSEDDIPDEEFYLNQIDGLSAYGFGDESDSTVQFPRSSRGSDSGAATEPVPERHVRFDFDSTHTFHLQMSSSPTISRALLPSALPEHGKVFGGPASAPAELHDDSTSEDSYDSDATDDCLPEEAHLSTSAGTEKPSEHETRTPLPPSPSPSPKPLSKRSSLRKGPPRGVFIDEGDKASGILDPTGKIMLITHPHLLGEEFACRYGSSATSSPDAGFEELIDESEIGDSQQQNGVTSATATDIMLASLNSSISDPVNPGQVTGPQEALYPAPGFQIGDYAFDVDDLEGDYQDDPELGEDVINMDDVIKFDDDSDDSDEPTSPIYMPPTKHLSGLGNVNNEFAHLTNENVTAFRRNADPTYATFSNAPSFSRFSEFSTPARSRKRKANDSPYTSSHYNGVTPVQRMRDPSGPFTPDSTVRPKRRRLMTA